MSNAPLVGGDEADVDDRVGDLSEPTDIVARRIIDIAAREEAALHVQQTAVIERLLDVECAGRRHIDRAVLRQRPRPKPQNPKTPKPQNPYFNFL